MNNGWMVPSCLLVSGGFFFPLVYHGIKYGLMKYGGNKLTNGDISLITEKLTCSVQAVIAVSTGVIIVTQIKDIMADTHWLTTAYAWFGIPYFVHDTWAIYQTFYWTSEPDVKDLPLWHRLSVFLQHRWLMLVHHLLLLFILFPMVMFWRRDMGDYFVGTGYMIEVTVPFLSLTHILNQLQLKDTKLFFVNGLCLLATFLCSRILVFPYLYWRYAVHAGIGLLEVPMSIPIKCNFGCLIILAPQVYWFRLLFRRAFQFFKYKQ
ncbi:hypothetical protein ACOMHN_063110 [Nucella lapillus]